MPRRLTHLFQVRVHDLGRRFVRGSGDKSSSMKSRGKAIGAKRIFSGRGRG